MDNKKKVSDQAIKKAELELKLIKLREVEIEDIELQIEELKLGDTLKAQQYNDMPTGSRQCSNNDSNLLKILSLKRKVLRYRMARKKIDNALNILDLDELEVVQMVLIDKVSINKTSQNTGKQRKTVKKIRDRALRKIAHFYDDPIKTHN